MRCSGCPRSAGGPPTWQQYGVSICPDLWAGRKPKKVRHMPVEAVSAESTELFVGTESAPLQIVRVSTTARGGAARVFVDGQSLRTPNPVDIAAYGQFGVEIAVDTHGAPPGTVLPARAVVEAT